MSIKRSTRQASRGRCSAPGASSSRRTVRATITISIGVGITLAAASLWSCSVRLDRLEGVEITFGTSDPKQPSGDASAAEVPPQSGVAPDVAASAPVD